MKKWIKIFLIGLFFVITVSGLGIYYYNNPLGSTNDQLEEGTILKNGSMNTIDTSHWGHGEINLVEFANGTLELQFTDVEIANGPDLFVYLSNKSSFEDKYDSPGQFANLGALKYNAGNFSIGIPTNTDIAEYNSCLIYCQQYSVLFTYAILN